MAYLDKLFPLIVMTLAFAMVSERLSNFLKLYLPAIFKLLSASNRSKVSALDSMSKKSFFVLQNLHLKQADAELEIIRERIILSLSLFSGILIAGLFELQIKEAVKEFWKEPGYFQIVFGFGILFSFGSKFWHDLLDLLLFTKNVRRRLGDVNLAEIESADQLSEYLQTNDQQIVKRAIEENSDWLHREFSNIRLILPRYEYINGLYQHCVAIYLEDNEEQRIPAYLPISGSSKKVPVKVIPDLGPVQAHSKPGEVIKLSGSSIRGAFGCMVRDYEDSKSYILTCAHVVTGRKCEVNLDEVLNTTKVDIDPEENCPVKKILFDGGFDCALVGPVNSSKHSNKLSRSKALRKPRVLSANDIGTDVYVEVNSNGLRWRRGSIVHHSKEKEGKGIEVNYDDGKKTFHGLIVAESESLAYKLTDRGDSGTILYDEEGQALGMVIGGDAKFSYAIPIGDVLIEFYAEII
ncbi:MAG: hypothetical protein HUU01_12355 [Saprospiraceae bacterium]|nr:hypothetical protein [Saprospiraceae bacterium]